MSHSPSPFLPPCLFTQVLHVRSLSEWAPLCIGPYSQANTLASHLHLLAGQIALHPPTMQLATGGLLQEVKSRDALCGQGT